MTILTDLLEGKSHGLRRQLTEEMHVRLFPAFTAPAKLSQIVTISGEGGAAADRAHADALCRAYDTHAPENGRYFVTALGEMSFVWERHTEFSTWTFIKEGPIGTPFEQPVVAELPAAWLENLPGAIIRATQIALIERAASPSDDLLRKLFNEPDLVTCEVMGGEARMWSDFRLHADGFGRMLIHDLRLSGNDASRLAQRLQELGNYRKMALLGLKPAQSYTPQVTALERRLSELAAEIARDAGNEEGLLNELSALSAELAKISAETRYRMSATRAYAQLAADRLRDIDMKRVAGYQTLFDFTDRRLTPAVRTCQSFTARLDDLSQRANWASGFLRTRLDMALKQQNRDLLASMNRRARLQLRLQQTVEGLSVAAISYYVIGLFGYIAKAAEREGVGIPHEVAMGISVPLVALGVWYLIRRVRSRADPDDKA